MDRQNVTEKKTHLCYSASSAMGSGGASTPPKVLICRKSEQNRWKFGQNWRPMLFDFKNGTQQFQKNTWRPFLDVIPKKVFVIFDLCGEILSGKPTKRFGQVWKFRAKILRNPKNLLLLHLCTSTDFQIKSGWCLNTRETESHFE